MYVHVVAIGGKIQPGQYNGFELGAAHSSATASVPASARGGKSMTTLTRANCLLRQAPSAKTMQAYDLPASANEIYKSE